MEYRAVAKNIKISPRKVRLVADNIRSLTIPAALVQLVVLRQRAAVPIKKTLESAIANASHNGQVSKESLTIKEIQITEGITYKRYHFAGRGRMRPYVKRTSHINITLENKGQEAPVINQETMKKVNTKKVDGVKKGAVK